MSALSGRVRQSPLPRFEVSTIACCGITVRPGRRSGGPVVEHLKQHVEDVGVRLLDLVE
jgi:hypothetical protein